MIQIIRLDMRFPPPQNHLSSLSSLPVLSSVLLPLHLLQVSYLYGCRTTAHAKYCTVDTLGRKWGIILAALIFSIGIAMQTAASELTLFVVGRVFAGLGVGLVSVLVPMYQSEWFVRSNWIPPRTNIQIIALLNGFEVLLLLHTSGPLPLASWLPPSSTMPLNPATMLQPTKFLLRFSSLGP